MKVRKLFVTGALSMTLAFSSFAVVPAFAVSFEDTVGIGSEMAITKLVSLGVLKGTGSNFNPDQEISRADFAFTAKQLTGANVSKGGKKVTYAELSKVLANGLGLKASWTNRSVDYLYYLDRKGVLDIDTDLDAAVTREAAAVAFDKFIAAKHSFETVSGVVVGVSGTGVSVNTAEGRIAYPFAKNISAFLSEQSSDPTTLPAGTPVELILNKSGQVAFLSGLLLDAEEGSLKLDTGKLKINDKFTKEIDSNVYLAPLPSAPNKPFTFADFGQYLNKGVSISGSALFSDRDEVTIMYPYISKFKTSSFGFTAEGVIATISEGFDLGLNFSGEVKVKIDDQDADLDTLRSYKRSSAGYTAVFEANASGQITTVTVTTNK